MKIYDAVKYVSEKFVYLSDKKMVAFDAWFVMPERPDGKLKGDCDDFALTCIWLACDRNIFKFILNVLILHKYRFYFSIAANGEKHLIGYAQNCWFDNWSLEALPEDQFFKKTKHKKLFFFPSPTVLIFMVFGLFYKKRSLTA